MADSGYISAPELTPSEFGLFSATTPVTTEDERWLRGSVVETESSPQIIKNFAALSEETVYTGTRVVTPNGTRSISASPNALATLSTSTVHNYLAGDQITVDLDLATTAIVTNRTATATVCTLTTSAPHTFSVGERITVSGVTARYNGTFSILSVTATTINYTSAGATEASVASTGSILNITISQGYNGLKIVSTVPSLTTLTYLTNTTEAASSSTQFGGAPRITNKSNRQYFQFMPFYIEIEDSSSTSGVFAVDKFDRIVRQIEAATQKNTEREFWEGTIARGEGHPTPYLRKASCKIVNGGVEMSATKALALLEFSVAEMSAVGEQGVIHMTRDVASVLGSQNLLRFEGTTVSTTNGTSVVIGSGYTGTGPLSAGAGAATTSTLRWMYATGFVGVHLGTTVIENDSLTKAFDVMGNRNDVKIKANRPVAAYFDPSIHLAVKVTLA